MSHQLIDKGLLWLKAQQVQYVKLEVDSENTSAIKVYTQAGFEKIGEREKAYPVGEKAIVMVKEL